MPTPDNDNPLQTGQQIYFFDVLCLRYSHKNITMQQDYQCCKTIKIGSQLANYNIYQYTNIPTPRLASQQIQAHHLLMSNVCFLRSQRTLSSRIMDDLHSPEEKELADVVGRILKNGNGKGSQQVLICEFLWVRQQIWLFPLGVFRQVLQLTSIALG